MFGVGVVKVVRMNDLGVPPCSNAARGRANAASPQPVPALSQEPASGLSAHVPHARNQEHCIPPS